MLEGLVDSISRSGVPLVAAIIALALGLLECFLGYRIFKVQVAVIAFLAGLSIGMSALTVWTGILWLAILVGVVIGALLALVSLKIYKVGVFLLVGFFAAAFAFGFTLNILIGVIAGVVVGLIAVFLTKPLIVLSTAFGGASIIAGSVGSLFWKSATLMPGWLNAVIVLGAGILGCVVQFTTTRGLKE